MSKNASVRMSDPDRHVVNGHVEVTLGPITIRRGYLDETDVTVQAASIAQWRAEHWRLLGDALANRGMFRAARGFMRKPKR